jgi:RND family efflux transporter MFP subunit
MDERQQQVATVSDSTESYDDQSATGGLRRSEGLEAFLNDLVERQCRLLDAVGGMVMMRPTKEQPSGLTAKYLADGVRPFPPRDIQKLAEIATKAVRENKALTEPLSPTSGLLTERAEYRLLATPLRLAGQPQGATVCILPEGQASTDLADGITRLELSGLMLEAFLWRQQAFAEAQSKIQLREALDLLDKSNQGHNATELASLFANELQRRFGCSRVSIGLVHHHAVRIVALSGTEHVDRKSELVEALESVMEECADQDIEVRYPQSSDLDPSERRVVRAHQSLSERFGPCSVASFPLRVDDGLIGVAVMERDPDDPFNDATLRLLRLIAEYLGPAAWTRRLADRGVLAVTRDRAIDVAQIAVGPRKTGMKLFALFALILFLVATVVPVPDRIVADGQIIAAQRRQISAPFSGRVDEVLVEPGDYVEEGQILIRLDTREAEIKLFQANTKSAGLRTQADEARSQGNTAEANMLGAQLRISDAEIRQLRDQIARAQIRAPISGTITQGRLDDMIGEVVDPNTPLIEISQLDTITAIALVPENGVARLEVGQQGRLAMTARPGEKLNFEVTSITPASEVFQQRNVYRVDVLLEETPDWLRPGMEGKAKIYGDYTNLLTIYARPMMEAIRMRLWW